MPLCKTLTFSSIVIIRTISLILYIIYSTTLLRIDNTSFIILNIYKLDITKKLQVIVFWPFNLDRSSAVLTLRQDYFKGFLDS